MNLAILVGTIVSPIRLIDLPEGRSLTKFHLKTVENLRVDGEIREKSKIHFIDVFNSYLQKEITPYLREGQMVGIQGSMESRKIVKPDGPDRWTTSVVIRTFGNITVYGGPGSQTATSANASEGQSPQNESPPPYINLEDGEYEDVPI